MNAHRNPKVLWVDIFVPYKQLCSYRNIPESSVVNVGTVLESEEILLASVAGTFDESHPAGRVLVRCIEIIQNLAFFVDLK